jgi:hypothetical protein
MLEFHVINNLKTKFESDSKKFVFLLKTILLMRCRNELLFIAKIVSKNKYHVWTETKTGIATRPRDRGLWLESRHKQMILSPPRKV